MHLLLTASAVAYGGATGALLPRPLYRFAVPATESWRAACPRAHPLTAGAAGWLGPARCGRCAVATRRYGARGSALGVVTALVCGALATAVGAHPELVVWLSLTPVGVLLAAVDSAVHRLPDQLTLPMAAGTVLSLGVVALLPGGTGSWPRALLGSAVLGAAYLLLFLISPAGMGFGDVKLALTAGLALGWYGWGALFLGSFAGVTLGALYGVSLVLARRAGPSTAMAFGPFMITGVAAGVVLGGLGG